MTECARPDCREPKAPGRIWCKKHDAKIPVVKTAGRYRCRKVRQNDEFFCGYCHTIWPVNDETPPKCRAEQEAIEKKK